MSASYFSGCSLPLLFVVFACGNTVEKPPYFVENPPRLVLYKTNDSVNLRCLTSGTAPISILWRKNGVDLDLKSPNVVRPDEGNVRISPATERDEGFYQCIATNKYGVTVSDVTRLLRAVLQSIGKTQLTNQLEVVEGQPFVIPASTFNVIPRSPDQYVWMKYAGELDQSPQRIVPDKRIQIAPNGDLHFAYVTSSDDLGGKLYMDAVSNPFLNITIEGNYTRLVVKSNATGVHPPMLSFSSVSRSSAIGSENVTMRCFFSGKEEPTINWMVERGSLPLGRYTKSNDDTELTLINVTKSDEMSYYCLATNSKGSETHEMSLEASPRFVKLKDSPQHARVLENDNVAFRCDAFAIPEANIVWFFNAKSLDEHPRKRFAISNDRKNLTISLVCRECKDPDGLDLSDSGVIQCNASNVHGYVLGTGYLDVISMKKAEVSGSSAHENSVPFEFAFIVILTIMVLISF